MKKLTLLFLLLIIFQVSFSQDTVICKVYYTFNCKSKPNQIENMILSIGRTSSVFESLDRKRFNETLKKSFSQKSFDTLFKINQFGMHSKYFVKRKEQKILIADIINKTTYLITDILPKIDWNLSNEHKNIQGFDCKKANITFRGRDYEIWFTNDLAIHGGPWKFADAPGLILEVNDIKNEFSFKFAGIEEKSPIEIINFPDSVSAISLKAFNKELKNQSSLNHRISIEGKYTPSKKSPTLLNTINPFEKIE